MVISMIIRAGYICTCTVPGTIVVLQDSTRLPLLYHVRTKNLRCIVPFQVVPGT